MQQVESSKPWPWWAWAIVAAPLAIFLALSLFDHPAYDDFWYANWARDMGFWNVQRYWYANWCGRYTATAVQTGFPLLCDMIRCYAWIPLCTLPAFALSVWLFLSAANRAIASPATRRDVALGSLVFVSLYFQQMPSPCEAFYWLAATATYLLPMLTALATVSCALAIRRENSWLTVSLATVLAALLAFVTAGGNESLLPVMLTTLTAATGYAVWRRHRSGWVWGAALAAFAAGATLVVLAPGNAHRAAHFHKSSLMAFLEVQPHLLKWFVTGPMGLGVMLLSIPLAQRLAGRMPWTRQIAGYHVACVGAAAWGAVLLSVLPCISMGLGPPNRVFNATYFLFLCGSFLTAFFLVAWFRNTGREILSAIPNLEHRSWALFIVGALFVGNLPWASYDLVCNAMSYDRQMHDRYAQLAEFAANRSPHAAIDRLHRQPKTIRPGNVDDDRAAADAMARYFHLATPKLTIR